jgi:hypothetical protein
MAWRALRVSEQSTRAFARARARAHRFAVWRAIYEANEPPQLSVAQRVQHPAVGSCGSAR